ncbi:hypothetical protein PAAG_12671 [Paracoccidioides lutzii Pb01]|uniref:Uncharacterized protein n=1 Tax=Paracoccidioides lutzii (strain ATCC MYA-826 / Pb01) TaxID=502779 RepID=A0A0A2UYN4_PARBA|nr:hypothetical protein PAAG_12671 [Paracoccidioides lutzii Pb01]KGQ00661.1 hypothetical protein PAAG_12671 [Paracoccidioides lutzii Pb01]
MSQLDESRGWFYYWRFLLMRQGEIRSERGCDSPALAAEYGGWYRKTMGDAPP